MLPAKMLWIGSPCSARSSKDDDRSRPASVWSFPRSGHVVSEIGDESIREVLYGGYRILHIVSGENGMEEVKILTVFHSSMPFGGEESS